MPGDNVIAANEALVVNRLRAKPVVYTVKITHCVIAGEWNMGVEVNDVEMDIENRRLIAANLREAADRLETWDAIPIDFPS